MIDTFISLAPTIGLLFFFSVFTGIAVWALNPSNKQRLQKLGEIPLKDDHHG